MRLRIPLRLAQVLQSALELTRSLFTIPHLLVDLHVRSQGALEWVCPLLRNAPWYLALNGQRRRGHEGVVTWRGRRRRRLLLLLLVSIVRSGQTR